MKLIAIWAMRGKGNFDQEKKIYLINLNMYFYFNRFCASIKLIIIDRKSNKFKIHK